MQGHTATVWRNCDAVCFDVDSTLVTSEGIDKLAEYCGTGDEVAKWTTKAMNENFSFRETLHKRLSIIRPTREKLESFSLSHSFVFSPSVRELIALLQERGVNIYLISGGFYSLVKPLAASLHIPLEHVYTNRLHFHEDGQYAGFDETQPTSRSGGKRLVVEKLLKEKAYKNLVMIGDGMTDLEAYPPAHLFIGYGGNKVRENVRKVAPCYVTDFNELITCLLEGI